MGNLCYHLSGKKIIDDLGMDVSILSQLSQKVIIKEQHLSSLRLFPLTGKLRRSTNSVIRELRK